MREILFRGMVKFGPIDLIGKFVVGSLVVYEDSVQIVNTDGSFVVDPETVGQYIGLKDKNGTMIFEGDRLMVGSWVDWDEDDDGNEIPGYFTDQSIHTVEYGLDYDFPGFNLYPSNESIEYNGLQWAIGIDDDGTCCEVIGNIHEAHK